MSYAFQINGFHSETIIPQRGLRQGDPLSPYLFILAFDTLSRLLNSAQQSFLISEIKLAKKAPCLTHLLFADDALLFGVSNAAEMYQIVNILNTFTAASGQKINLSKSGLICAAGASNVTKNLLASIIQVPIWESPGNYLGIPAQWGRAKNQSLQFLKERIFEKLDSWKGVF